MILFCYIYNFFSFVFLPWSFHGPQDRVFSLVKIDPYLFNQGLNSFVSTFLFGVVFR